MAALRAELRAVVGAAAGDTVQMFFRLGYAPPPPPNQTIFVRTEDPILLKDLPQAVWIEGTLHAQKQESDLADAAYIIDLTRVEKYEY